MEKIRKGDDVVVIAGKDKGKRGLVITVQTDGYLVVEGVNAAQKHQKPNPTKGIQGGIVQKIMPIHRSNVLLFNTATKSGDRVGIKILVDGKKVRFFKSNGEVVGG
jgi:large subunit ribosomal protein L24